MHGVAPERSFYPSHRAPSLEAGAWILRGHEGRPRATPRVRPRDCRSPGRGIGSLGCPAGCPASAGSSLPPFSQSFFVLTWHPSARGSAAARRQPENQTTRAGTLLGRGVARKIATGRLLGLQCSIHHWHLRLGGMHTTLEGVARREWAGEGQYLAIELPVQTLIPKANSVAIPPGGPAGGRRAGRR